MYFFAPCRLLQGKVINEPELLKALSGFGLCIGLLCTMHKQY